MRRGQRGCRQRRGMLTVTAAVPSPDELEAAQKLTVLATAVVFGGLAVGLGLKGEPEPCPACAQRGGETCIFCDGTGRREAPIKISKRERNDDSILGLTRRSPLECTARIGFLISQNTQTHNNTPKPLSFFFPHTHAHNPVTQSSKTMFQMHHTVDPAATR